MRVLEIYLIALAAGFTNLIAIYVITWFSQQISNKNLAIFEEKSVAWWQILQVFAFQSFRLYFLFVSKV